MNRTAFLAGALGSLILAGGLLAMSGGPFTINATGTGSGGGTMNGGSVQVAFAVAGAAAPMAGGAFNLQPGALGAAGVARRNLDSAHSFPQPFKPSLGHDRITFSALTSQVDITIYTMSGQKVKTLHKNDPLSDQVVWTPVTNDQGGTLSSGVYLFVIVSPGLTPRKGKLMIIK